MSHTLTCCSSRLPLTYEIRTVLAAMCAGLEWTPDRFANALMGDYTNKEQRAYKLITEPDKLPTMFTDYLDEYNVSFPTQMHLVFFKDAIAHLSRIARILRQPRGNALLVGVGGSGRQSLTRLASFVSEFKLVTIEITRVYGMTEWHEDLKKMLMSAGIQNTDLGTRLGDG